MINDMNLHPEENKRYINFIDDKKINALLNKYTNVTDDEIEKVLEKASKVKGLSLDEIALLLSVEKPEHLKKIFQVAEKIKYDIYGKRIVVFAPLYISDYCVNNCTYCGFQCKNDFSRRKLSQEEIKEEVRLLESMGHKRLALEVGEDPKNCPIEYVLESIKTIYSTQNNNGNIRRINVNIAATTVENYKQLKEAEIGTYILFQETYHKETYLNMHPNSIKGDYHYHLTAFDRAMEAGIDDVGGGALFGLADYKYELLALMMHNEHLETNYGVGFHTVSVPRLRVAEGVSLENYPHLLDDSTFKKLVAILRLAIPYTGIILSTRENEETRKELLHYGVSQISAGSCTGVGGYKEREEGKDISQFETEDNRSPLEVIKALVSDGYIPSYCTACYRMGRTGDRFMELAKSGEIKHVCEPNALLTLKEFALDYGDEALIEASTKLINDRIDQMENNSISDFVDESIAKIEKGNRDIYL